MGKFLNCIELFNTNCLLAVKLGIQQWRGCATCFFFVCVIDVKEVRISQSTSVKEGETLNLTCSVESFPPSLIAWTKLSDQNGTGRNLQNDTLTDLRNDTERHPQEKGGTATLYIPNVAAEDSGQYICTVQHLNNTWTGNVNVTVICKCIDFVFLECKLMVLLFPIKWV